MFAFAYLKMLVVIRILMIVRILQGMCITQTTVASQNISVYTLL